MVGSSGTGPGCLLAVRAAPHPGALIAPCTNDVTDLTNFTNRRTATVANLRTGVTISAFSISNEGWTGGKLNHRRCVTYWGRQRNTIYLAAR